ncbi:protein phosphatase 2C [Bacillus sp. SIMBA_069]
MLNKLKKFMVVTAAAVMLSTGFATVAPKEAHAAHWADDVMEWAMVRSYILVDMRDSLATRQDMWLILTRAKNRSAGYNYESARDFVKNSRISDGTRGTNWVTRDEAATMALQAMGYYNIYHPSFNFTRTFGIKHYIYDGTRGDEFATRAEVVSMIYFAAHSKGFYY